MKSYPKNFRPAALVTALWNILDYRSAVVVERRTMKTALAVLFSITLVSAIHAQEQKSRTWTATDGRTITGTLRAKTETTAEIILPSGKAATVKLEALSDYDRKHVDDANVAPVATVTAKTVISKSSLSAGKKDAKAVEVTVARVSEPIELVVLWIGERTKSDYGVYRKVTRKVDAAMAETFEVVYDPSDSHPFNKGYRGYVVGLRDASGKWIAQTASMKAFERFLDDAK